MVPQVAAARRADSARRRLAPLGRHRVGRVAAAGARSGEGPVRLHPRRGDPRRAASAKSTTSSSTATTYVEPQGPDPRRRHEVGADALHEDAGDSRATACRTPRRTSPAGSAGAAWPTSRSSWIAGGLLITLGNGSALPLDGGLVRNVRRSRAGRHARGRAADKFDASRPSRSRTATRRDHLGVPLEPADLRRAPGVPALHGHAVGHAPAESARRARTPRSPPRTRRTRRTEGRKPKDPTDAFVVSGGVKNGRRPRRPAGDPRSAGREGARARLQLQPDPSRPQPLGLPVPLERHPELERAAAAAALTESHEERSDARSPRRGLPCSAPLPARAQSINPGFPDPFRLTEPKNFEAFRATSNNEDWNSNDDSKRPIPGETIVLADLQGPGVVTHIWLTIADNEYALAAAAAAARLLRRQPDPERRRAGRRLLRRRPRLRARVKSADGRATAPRAGRATATGRCRSRSPAGSR